MPQIEDVIGGIIGAGQHRNDTGDALRGRRFNRFQPGVRMRRTHHRRMELARQIQIV